MALRDDILRVNQPRLQTIRAFGRDLYVRVMKGAERDLYEGGRVDIRGPKDIRIKHDNARARLVVLVLCDADGQRIFGDDDIAAVGELPADELDRVYEAGLKLNGMDAGAMERLEKNSGPAASAGSISSSPASSAAPSANCSSAWTPTS